jgi:hypothetical protein
MAVQLTWNAFTTPDQDHYSDTDAAAPAVKVKTLTPVSMPAPVHVLIPDVPVIESHAVEKEIIEKEIVNKEETLPQIEYRLPDVTQFEEYEELQSLKVYTSNDNKDYRLLDITSAIPAKIVIACS